MMVWFSGSDSIAAKTYPESMSILAEVRERAFDAGEGHNTSGFVEPIQVAEPPNGQTGASWPVYHVVGVGSDGPNPASPDGYRASFVPWR